MVARNRNTRGTGHVVHPGSDRRSPIICAYCNGEEKERGIYVQHVKVVVGQGKLTNCQYKGPEATIALNYRFVSEPLKEMEEKRVRVSHCL